MKFLTLGVLMILACSAAEAAAPGPVSRADQAALTRDNNAFAVEFYAHLRARPGNLFFSPESISTAFGMAYAGARGETATEMTHVFHFTLPPDRLHPAMGALLDSINAAHTDYELHSADALWAQRDESFLDSYLRLMQADYGAGFHRVDFRANPEAVRTTINEWVEQQTHKRIQNLIGSGVLTPLTRLVLTNAIYFKGTWMAPFEKGETEESGEFHVSAGQTVKTPLMHRSGGYRYYDGGSFQELELLYKSGELGMIVLLPKDPSGLDALERQFTAANADQWLRKLEPADRVIVTLPRFTMTRQMELSDTLSAMGMRDAFTGAADFSGMTGKPGFSISAAIHKAFIDVNEQGTEAAAATATMMVGAAMRAPAPEPPPIVFRADHPFLFLIRNTATNGILFMGRVDDPTQ